MRRTTALAALAAPLAVTLAVLLLGSCDVFLGPEPAGPQQALRSLWNDFNETHAYIDIRMSYNQDFKSWDDVYEHYSKLLLDRMPEGAPSYDSDGRYLFYTCCDMIGELKDPHVSLYAPGGNFFWSKTDDMQKTEEGWFNLSVIKRNYLEDLGAEKGNYFTYGKFKQPNDNIGYLYIASFTEIDKQEQPGWEEAIDGIMEYFLSYGDDIKAVVVDVRCNSGGSCPIAEYIAARFATVQKNYMKASGKNGPGRNDFSAPMTFRVRPEGTRFTKRAALLTNRATVSAAEWFAMAMKTQSHVTHVGTPTRGAFSPRISRPMINGWYYTISSFRVTDMNGKCYEGTGISPEPEYIFSGDEEYDTASGRRDIQLEKALLEVRKWLNE